MSPFRLSRAILAAGAVVVGAVLILRPFATPTSLAVTLGVGLALVGLGEILRAQEHSSRVASIAGCLILAAAMITAAWPGLPLPSVGIVVAAGLAVFGIARIVDAVRASGAGRVADLLVGVAGVSLAVIAAADPDLSLFTVCLLLGATLVWSGVAGLFYAIGRRAGVDRPRAPRIVGGVIAVVISVPLAVFAVEAYPTAPTPDAFYQASADGEPGTLLRVEPHTAGVPAGARAWRILYTTENEAGRPAVAGGLVVAAAQQSTTPVPVIAWAHATTGVAQGCAPSLMRDPFGADSMPALSRALAAGWAVVAPDYIGLGTAGPHPYLIGRSEARSVLDAVRAARSVDQLNLSHQTVLWGRSQGGHAALWADVVGAQYAPDVPLAGVAAAAPTADLRALAETLDSSSGDPTMGAYLLDAYTSVYSDVHADDYVRLQARLPMQRLAHRCRADTGHGYGLIRALAVGTDPFQTALNSGALGRRLSENTPIGATATPLLVMQGDDDRVAVPAAQTGYVERRRALGANVEYRTYPGRDHDSLLADGSPAVDELLTWTRDRLS
ncbi:lipase family protein [Gordonia hydrophobica]|uniref:Lipase family protein n=1 Tax=Gordonia hydrophobica TaxID=40516 RepID=A0ABZ2TX19_9ACTN|nr:lipase family protein [Gordonia hydrophobica]MBM7366243.1 uncharacterized membrane protein HdeD (DUF308 family)/alpha-beta hydrolase superfamily lysophospholipase [Gordonia hydrophobica]